MLKDYHKVSEIVPRGDTVTVRTNMGDFEGRKVIITTGPWGPAMLKKMGVDLPFKVSLHSHIIGYYGRAEKEESVYISVISYERAKLTIICIASRAYRLGNIH